MSSDHTVTESQWSWYSYINPLNVGYLFTGDENSALGRNAPSGSSSTSLKAGVSNVSLYNARCKLRAIAVSDADILKARSALKKVQMNSHKNVAKAGDSYENGTPLRELHEVFGAPIEPEDYE